MKSDVVRGSDVAPLGRIESSSSYPLREFQRLTGLGDAALRQARRKGLQVIQVGRRKFVRGAAWESYLQAQEKSRQPGVPHA